MVAGSRRSCRDHFSGCLNPRRRSFLKNDFALPATFVKLLPTSSQHYAYNLNERTRMIAKDAYREKMAAQIEEQEAKLAQLKARAKQAVADGKIAAGQEIEAAEAKLAAARARLKELSEAGDDAWETFKDGCDEAWNSFSAACRRAVENFK
jgi:hypothetical protein